VLIKSNFFPSGAALEEIIRTSFFLHLGTFFAALVYFRKEVANLLRSVVTYRHARAEEKSLLKFLCISTLVSGTVGLILLYFIGEIDARVDLQSHFLNILVGILLLVTAGFQLKTPSKGLKNAKDLTTKDGLILGVVQGFSALPGISRSGLTVSALLLRNYDKEAALRLSFLMSLPIVLGANIILNTESMFSFSALSAVSIIFAFIFGIITIDLLLKLARRINFGVFVLFFGLLTILSAFV
jgi:undecaprenyl-diphosphatase